VITVWSPIVVEHFLAEAFRARSGKLAANGNATKANVGTHPANIKVNVWTSDLPDQLPVPVQRSTGRSTLLAFMSEFVHSEADLKALRHGTGVSCGLEIADGDICLCNVPGDPGNESVDI
jgi:hypothetical protein